MRLPFLMRRPLAALALLLLALAAPAGAQTEGLLQVEDELHAFLERQQALGHLPGATLGAKPLSAYEARALLDTLAVQADTAPEAFSTLDRRLLAQYRGAEVGGLLRGLTRSAPWLYGNGTTALSVEGDGYGLEAEPLAVLALGPVRQTQSQAQEGTTTAWQNTRGVRAAGHLDAGRGFGRVFFETRIEENQVRVPAPAYTRGNRTAPRLGFVARPSDGVYDYFVATGVVGYHTERFEARFGRDRNRWGFGRESVALSNYATVYDQLQLRWKVWRLDFTNLFTRFTEPGGPSGGGDRLYPSRYGAFHRLAIDLGYGLEAEAFEAIIFGTDSTGRGGFELAYLNPFQFYRGTERELGSPDNALLGAGLAWTATPGLRLYGQFILDELKVAEFFNDWWGNKWAYLAGAHVVDPPMPGAGRLRGLDLRLEYTRLRPYLYAHRAPCRDLSAGCPPYLEQPPGAAYVHYGDVLGHPAGPNASDLAFSVRYRPVPDFAAALDVVYTRLGRNEVTADGAVVTNYGSDPNVPSDTRPSNDAVVTLWGIRQNRILVEGRAEVRLLPQLFAGGALRYASVDDGQVGLNRYLSPQVMLRWGLPFPSLRY